MGEQESLLRIIRRVANACAKSIDGLWKEELDRDRPLVEWWVRTEVTHPAGGVTGDPPEACGSLGAKGHPEAATAVPAAASPPRTASDTGSSSTKSPEISRKSAEAKGPDWRSFYAPWAWMVDAPIGSIRPLCHTKQEAEELVERLTSPAEIVPLYRHMSTDYELRLEVSSLRARNKDLQLANDKLLKRLAEGISPEANEANAKRRQKAWECEGTANWGLGVARDISVLYDKIELLRSRIAELEKQP